MGGAKANTSGIKRPEDAPMYQIIAAKQGVGQQYLQNQAQLLQMYSQMPPATQAFDSGQVSKEASELGIENTIRSREFERLTDPSASRMRGEMGSRVAELTSMEATQRSMDELAKKQGLTSGYSSGAAGTIRASGMYDAGTEAGRQARLRNLALQQGYLAQTPAPIGGLDPATAIEAEMAAKAANLQAMQQFQQNVITGGQRLQQSTSDFINQNLGELSQANQTAAQNKRAYEEALYKAAVQTAASQNAMSGQMIGAGGAVAGAALGAAIMI